MDFKVIGVTGPIVSGKSAFCNFLKEFGFSHIETDVLVKEIYRQKQIKRWLRNAFGSEIFGADGSINLRTLGRIIFNDVQSLKKLEDYIYPAVFEEVRKKIGDLKKDQSVRGIAIEAVKLFESGSDKICDISVAVVCSRENQIERLNQKGLPFSKIMAIFACQKSAYFYSLLSDFAIENNGSLEEFKEKSLIFFKEKVFKNGKI